MLHGELHETVVGNIRVGKNRIIPLGIQQLFGRRAIAAQGTLTQLHRKFQLLGIAMIGVGRIDIVNPAERIAPPAIFLEIQTGAPVIATPLKTVLASAVLSGAHAEPGLIKTETVFHAQV